MESNWDKTAPRTNYHFDAFKNDPAYDSMNTLVSLLAIGTKHDRTIEKTITWRTRNPIDSPNGSEDIEAEELDLIKSNAPADLTLTNLDYQIEPVFQRMTDALHLLPRRGAKACSRTVSGQVWNLHIDKLEKWHKSEPEKVYRFMVMLNENDISFSTVILFIHIIVQEKFIVLIGINVHTVLQMQSARCTLLITGVATPEMHMLFSKYDNKIEV